MWMNARDAAFFAILRAEKGEAYIEESLSSFEDHALAYEIASGVMRMRRLLDFQAKLLAPKLPAKLKEKICLRMGLYQLFYLTRMPDHAIIFETVELAKRVCGPLFAKFLNAMLRKCGRTMTTLPDDLPTRYSYSDYFVDSLLKTHAKKEVEALLQAGNSKPPLFARKRPGVVFEELDSFIDSPEYYIQNPTQALLLAKLAEKISPPSTILDLCAAPGGKTLLLHDLFPHAQLSANDISENRLQRLSQNLLKYGVQASVSCKDATKDSFGQQYDLVVVDAPCSNSGVLYKCPEARWRLEKDETLHIQQTQKNILQAASKLVKKGGYLWYLTCSILPQENEEVVLASFPEAIHFTELPRPTGFEGGFAALISF